MMTVAARMMIAMAIIAVGSHLLKMEIRKKRVPCYSTSVANIRSRSCWVKGQGS